MENILSGFVFPQSLETGLIALSISGGMRSPPSAFFLPLPERGMSLESSCDFPLRNSFVCTLFFPFQICAFLRASPIKHKPLSQKFLGSYSGGVSQFPKRIDTEVISSISKSWTGLWDTGRSKWRPWKLHGMSSLAHNSPGQIVFEIHHAIWVSISAPDISKNWSSHCCKLAFQKKTYPSLLWWQPYKVIKNRHSGTLRTPSSDSPVTLSYLTSRTTN